MKTMNDASNQIREFVFSHFPLARKRSVLDADPLLDSGIVDSLGVLDMVDFLEKEFNIIVSDDELLPENFQSISRLSTFVQSKLKNSSTIQSEE